MKTVTIDGQQIALVAERRDREGGIVIVVAIPSGDGISDYIDRAFVGSGDGDVAVFDATLPAWNSTTRYALGARIKGAGHEVWQSLVDNNRNNQLSPGAFWQQVMRPITDAEKTTEQAAAIARYDTLPVEIADVPLWAAATVYATRARVRDADGSVWISVEADNVGNPPSATARQWRSEMTVRQRMERALVSRGSEPAPQVR